MTGIYIGKKELKLHHHLSFFTRTEANATHLVPHIFHRADSPKSRISQLCFYINIHNFYVNKYPSTLL